MPDSLLFIFGPKSSGKTTLLSHFIEQNLPGSRYEIKHFRNGDEITSPSRRTDLGKLFHLRS